MPYQGRSKQPTKMTGKRLASSLAAQPISQTLHLHSRVGGPSVSFIALSAKIKVTIARSAI